MFPKCILWAPMRGGVRSAKKGNMAHWWHSVSKSGLQGSDNCGKQQSNALARGSFSTRKNRRKVRTRNTGGDVKKALQMLGSAHRTKDRRHTQLPQKASSRRTPCQIRLSTFYRGRSSVSSQLVRPDLCGWLVRLQTFATTALRSR